MNKDFVVLWKGFFTKNGSYKVVALFVSLVLWVTILGRKDIVLTHEVDLQIHLAPNQVLRNELPKKVQVRLSGPRMGLKKFAKSEELITLDLAHLQAGRQRVEIPKESLALPLGVKVVSITPAKVRADIRWLEGEKKNE